MTPSRGAKMCASRKNNKAHRELPLFPDSVLLMMGELTTVEAEEARLERLHAVMDERMKAIKNAQEAKQAQTPILRAWAQKILPADLFDKTERWINNCPDYYGYGIYMNTLADYLGIHRMDAYKSITDFLFFQRSTR